MSHWDIDIERIYKAKIPELSTGDILLQGRKLKPTNWLLQR